MPHKPPSNETTEISLRLTNYEEIFSGFDLRPDHSRAISADFLDEVRRASRDKRKGEIEFILHIPKKDRHSYREEEIKKRLNTHFKKHHHLLLIEKRKVNRRGIAMIVTGIIAMLAATRIVFYDPTKSLLLSFLVVFLEPAAWFLLWEGMDQLIYDSKELNPELGFYSKMAAAHGHTHFRSY
ncbi:MAG: hypothetical protein WEC39_02060 [Patescibacteria group bacterium]